MTSKWRLTPKRLPIILFGLPSLVTILTSTVLVGATNIGCAQGTDLTRRTPVKEDGGFLLEDAVAISDGEIDLEAGPAYAVTGVQPSHGPFAGGTRVVIRGRGFSSRTRVRFGGADVAVADTIASDPTTVQATVPPGDPGPVDVTVRDELNSNTATLKGAFTYDSFYASPANGSTDGGTKIEITGRSTGWKAGTTVAIDGKACGDVVVDSATKIRCVTPAGLPGSKSISIQTPDGIVSSVRDAYVYADTSDGYRGGLAGDVLPGELRVLALVEPKDKLLSDATVVVQGADGTIQTGKTNGSGVASFATPPPAPLTVTISKKCISPTTFEGVRVRSVTAYLSPIMSVACVPPDGTPPPGGGKLRELGQISGEIVWPGGTEFRRSNWAGIPDAKGTQRQVAYVFVANRDPTGRFELPTDPTSAITPTTPGKIGYQFDLTTIPGNQTIYAIAGLEDRPPGKPVSFEPFSYGLLRGVGSVGGKVTGGVYIQMVGTFNYDVLWKLDTIPSNLRGPDRTRSTINIDLGDAFMNLPNGSKENLLPIGGNIGFVAIPPLLGPLESASYSAAVEATTGGSGGAPISAILRQRFRTTGSPVTIGPFVPLPKFKTPALDKAWDGRTVEIELAPKAADLIVISVTSSDGTSSWTIVMPGDTRKVILPDFKARPELGMPPGDLTLGVTAALVNEFTYDALGYNNLYGSRWRAYAYDTAFGKY